MVSQFSLNSIAFLSPLVTLAFESTFLDAPVYPHIKTVTLIPFPHPIEHQRIDVAHLALAMVHLLSHTAAGLLQDSLASQGRLSHHLETNI